MRRIVSLGQMLEIEPRIDLGSADVGVAQQLLYGAQITAGLQHMAGKRMAQHVRVHRRGQPRLQAAAAQALPDRLGGQPCAIAAYEQRSTGGCRFRLTGYKRGACQQPGL